MQTYRGLRQAFRLLNRGFMVPVFRSGLGATMVSPFAGYIMLLSTIGHKTGRLRRTPVNYALIDGEVYCIAGFGSVAHWARNLAAIPEAEVQLPAGRFWGRVQVLTDEADRLRVGRQILKNAGFAGFVFGYMPLASATRSWRGASPTRRSCGLHRRRCSRGPSIQEAEAGSERRWGGFCCWCC